MSRRIDIELTSDRGDGSWTWRAAGAKQPKGVVAGGLLPDGAAVGQVLRADIEASLDGTDVVAVLPPKQKNRAAVETIEIISRPISDDQLVTSKLAGRGGRDRGDRGDRGDRRGGRDRGPRPDGDRRPRSDGDRRPRGDGERRGGPGGDREGGRGPRPDRPRRDKPAPPPKPKAKRLRPGRTHRKAALEALPAAEQVIAEQVLLGGIPAVRQAVEKQNAQARAEGGREISADALVAIAERLLPGLRAAEWRDRAEAALADLAELDLRDLRSVVVAADSGAKDEESRELAGKLREGLTQRLDAEQAAWLAELTETLAEGRVVRALRLSSRPPKAGAPLPAELATKLAEAASAALTADTFADRWATVLDALSFSPVRLTVAPASKPEEPSAELVAAVTRLADRVPKVAEAFGIDPASAPKRRSRGGKPGAKAGGAPRPPKPPKPPKPAPAAPAATEDVAHDEAVVTPAPAEPATAGPVTADPSTDAPAAVDPAEGVADTEASPEPVADAPELDDAPPAEAAAPVEDAPDAPAEPTEPAADAAPDGQPD